MFEMARADEIRALQERIHGMQRTRLADRTLPTSAALAELLPGGALAAGASYVVDGSTALALELLREPSRAGSWCAVVGMPDLGIEAAAAAGLDLERLVLVPHPGEQWFAVVSALVDAVAVVLVQPPAPARVGESPAARLAARLRRREAVLVAMREWPRAEARLAIAESDWAGAGAGFGHLRARQVTVASRSPAWQGRTRSRRLWLPDASGAVSPVVARVLDEREPDGRARPRMATVG
ncbi:hypothetical protein [Protaetiibacter mangrovi]|uniref:Protein ImuA n=1 Tax=Protaetiibacter mangrovi TaxID=2970926 RepID=A0ABT1ZC63_9MICO|nr:hypothetical protein [Protaetiibacter mangrovi]MCS0498295.1 hypothetical protein [Protaetiibacter mangrovi]TPX05597.1 hypothetical protein FJ656_05665 [Schumannella luteola]